MNVYGIKIKKFYRIFLTLRVHEKDSIFCGEISGPKLKMRYITR